MPERRPQGCVKVLTVDDKRHGEYRGYLAHVSQGIPMCDPCREAKRLYSRRWDKARRSGRAIDESYVTDLEPFRKHVERLVRSGMTYADIAREAGLAPDTIRKVRLGETNGMLLSTARRLARVTPGSYTKRWPALGTRRRLQALIALGHEAKYLADRLGMAQTRFSMLINGKSGRSFVLRQTWEDVARLYDELSMVPGSSTRSRRIAMQSGWPPPLAWDDIDDPKEQPERWAYQSHGDRNSLICDLADQGYTLEEACRALHMSADTLQVWCARHGLSAQYRRISMRSVKPGFKNGVMERVG